MKNLQLIVEYSDCIIQGKDLLNFKIIIDEDQKRIEEAKIEEEYQSRGLPNQG